VPSLECHSPSLTIRSVNEVVPRGKAVKTAIAWAVKICENSPDAVQAAKHGLMLGLLRGGVDEAFVSHTWSEASKKAWTGENIKVYQIHRGLVQVCLPHAQEGLRAFSEVRSSLSHSINLLTA
jgi:1,4-dihydroxy-2-naphthoyl-CoA synthase